MEEFFYPLLFRLAVKGLFGEHGRGRDPHQGLFHGFDVLATFGVDSHDLAEFVEADRNRIHHRKALVRDQGFNGPVEVFVERAGKTKLRLCQDFPEDFDPLIALLDGAFILDGRGGIEVLFRQAEEGIIEEIDLGADYRKNKLFEFGLFLGHFQLPFLD